MFRIKSWVVGLAVSISLASAAAAQQSFIIDDSDQRVSYEWISNSMQQLGQDELALVIPGSFDETLSDGAVDPDYTLEVSSIQTSTIETSAFEATGSASFYFEAGEFAQGGSAEIDSRSFFYLFFEPESEGVLSLGGQISSDSAWTSVRVLVEAYDGSFSFDRDGTQSIDLQIPIALGQFVLIQLIAEVDYSVDDPFFFETFDSGAASFSIVGTLTTGPEFTRGDCNQDTGFDVADAVASLESLFVASAPVLSCRLACDSNDDGTFDISDAIFTLAALFTGGPPPAAPFPDCGTATSSAALPCDTFDGC